MTFTQCVHQRTPFVSPADTFHELSPVKRDLTPLITIMVRFLNNMDTVKSEKDQYFNISL